MIKLDTIEIGQSFVPIVRVFFHKPGFIFDALDAAERATELRAMLPIAGETFPATADELVAAAIKRLAEIFANERDKLEQDWDRNDNVSTEDLRIALRRYRSFFDRLLSV